MSDTAWTLLHSYLHGEITEDAAASALADLYDRDGWMFYYEPVQNAPAIQPALASLYVRYVALIESRHANPGTGSSNAREADRGSS